MKRRTVLTLAAMLAAVSISGQQKYNPEVLQSDTGKPMYIADYQAADARGTCLPGFIDNESFRKYMSGQKMISVGATTAMISACTAVGCSFIPDRTPRTVTLAVSGIIGGLGCVISLTGLYKTRRWRFDAGGITCTF